MGLHACSFLSMLIFLIIVIFASNCQVAVTQSFVFFFFLNMYAFPFPHSVMVAYDPDALRPRTERIADVVNAAAVPVAAVPAEVVKRAKGQLSGEYHYDEKRKSRRNTSSNAKEKDGKPTEMEEEKADNVEETKRKKEPETNN